MPALPEVLTVLIVDDDISTLRELEETIDDAHVNLQFADTSNAISRILETHSIDLAAISVHEGTVGMIEPLARQLRALNSPVPLIALVCPEPQSAAHAAMAGVDGCARIDDTRTVKRLLASQIQQMRNVRTQVEALNQVSDIHERYNLLLETSSEAIAYLHQGLHIYANPSYLEQFGYLSFDDLEGYSILDLLSSTDDQQDLKSLLKSFSKGLLPNAPIAVTGSHADGSTFNALVEFSPAHYEGESCIQIMVREQFEAADNAELQQELEKLRTHDLLTGLLNRQAFVNTLKQEFEQTGLDSDLAVLLVSLDDQSGLQQSIGTSATDQLVVQTAALFNQAAERSMLPARLSDHVFALRVWLDDREQAAELAKRLVETFSGKILQIEGKSPTVTASVGLAVGGKQVFTVDELLGYADQARQEAMRTGGNSYVRYRPSTDHIGDDTDEQWAERLRHALNNSEFRLVSLPVTDMEDDDFLLNEVEIRLRAEDSDEVILPSAFRPAAAACGLSSELDRDLINRLVQLLAEDTAETNAANGWLLPLSVSSLSDSSLIKLLESAILAKRLNGRKLIIGFSEADVREQMLELQRFISRFATYGVRFALLDVRLNSRVGLTMKNIETSYIKLDQQVTVSLNKEKNARDLLKQLVHEANENNTYVIAPHTDNTTDLATLWQAGITLVQGQFDQEE
ncbi:MAG: EAL domain-containing protein [Pseudomonadota bacterium]